MFIIFICINNVHASKSKDIFEVLKDYADTLETSTENNITSVEIINEGVSLDTFVDNQVNNKLSNYFPEKNPSYDVVIQSGIDDKNFYDVTEETTSDLDIDFSSSYFSGASNFTNLSQSIADAQKNKWSSIKSSYSEFDDNGADNVIIIATAYTSAAEENGGYAGMNAIGGTLGPGCIAAPKDIAFHTKIRISGLGVFNVEDRGGAIKRLSDDIIRVDVWMNSYSEAMRFGKRIYKGRIL